MKYLRLTIVLTGLLAACSDAQDPVLVDSTWVTSCANTTGACSIAEPYTVVLLAYNGEVDETTGKAYDASCYASDVGNGNLNIALRAYVGGNLSGDGVRVSGLVVNRDSGALVGDGCRMLFLENGLNVGGNANGVCGAAAPSESQPCQITSANIDNATNGIELLVRCESVNAEDEASQFRNVSGSGLGRHRHSSFRKRSGI
ncbi:MAG: hypothetical protein R3A47_00290 [Polyangiales bacterium]